MFWREASAPFAFQIDWVWQVYYYYYYYYYYY